MSDSSYPYSDYAAGSYELPATELQFVPRSRFQWVFFTPSVFLAAVSWMANGIPLLTNLSFIFLMVACMWQLAEELLNLCRFGMGGITLFTGVLLWFCYDYMVNWFFIDFNSPLASFPASVIAKSACLHHLFVLFAVMGLHLPIWGQLERFIANLPEPKSHQLYLWIIVIAFLIGLVPYAFFTVEPLPVVLWKDIFGGRVGGAGFTVGRNGNLNYSWGAYLAQLLQVGQVGALLGIFYAIVLRPPVLATTICLFTWLLQVGLAFGSGTRGATAFMIMPPLFLFFLKYHSQSAELFKRFSIKAYVVSGVLGMVILALLQVQISYRNVGFSEIQLEQVSTHLEGNSMFSEGLQGMALIPETSGFFYNSVPGQGALMAVPELSWRFIYGPIPRALWPGKPIDPVWRWYNSVITHRSEDDMEGTTISTGLIGDWYFRFGLAGIIEGGLLFGWFFAASERFLQNSQGRLIPMLTAIGLLVFLFRSFRGMAFLDLYPLLIGLTALVVLIKLTRSVSSHS